MEKYLLENEYIKMWWEESIFCCSYETPLVDLETAKKMVGYRLGICDSKTYPLFVDIRKVQVLKNDARHYLAHEEGAKCISACAILIESELSKMIGNFFLNVNKPANPAKLFTKKEDAMLWLQKFV